MIDQTRARYKVGKIEFAFGDQIFCNYCDAPIANYDMVFISLDPEFDSPFDTKACMFRRLMEEVS